MAADYMALRDNIHRVMDVLLVLSERIDDIQPENRDKYPNPQLRLWSGYAKDLEQFTSDLEDWIRQPEAAESRRLLVEIAQWSSSGKQQALEQICSDSRFLSDNANAIRMAHDGIAHIGYDPIKKATSSFALSRFIEKDMTRALSWVTNAGRFSAGLEQLEAQVVTTNLAKRVKKDLLKELLKVNSFADSQESRIDSCRQSLAKADGITSSIPLGVPERALLESYSGGTDVISSLSRVNEKLNAVRTLLVALEWVKESVEDNEYKIIWKAKQTALKGKSIENIERQLSDVLITANNWKTTQKSQMEGMTNKLRRMSNSLGQETFTEQIRLVEANRNKIDWGRPDLPLIWSSLNNARRILEEMRHELLNRLKSEDAMSIVESPEIIADMGEGKGWSFERFIRALEITLREGLIDIQVAEEK